MNFDKHLFIEKKRDADYFINQNWGGNQFNLFLNMTFLGFTTNENNDDQWNYGVPGVVRRHLFHMCNLDDHHLIYNLNLLLK